MDGLGIAFAIGIIAFGLIASAFQKQRLRERTDELRALAARLGWKFDEEDFDNDGNRVTGFHIGSIGGTHSVTNLMSGKSNGISVKVFDFEYVIGSGKNSRTVCQTVLELAQLGGKRTNFFLRPERAWWNRSLFESYQDFDFESHPEFSQRYELSGDNEAAVRELFTPEVLTFFERKERLSVEGRGGRLIYYREGISVEPGEIRAFVDEARCCLRLLEDSAK